MESCVKNSDFSEIIEKIKKTLKGINFDYDKEIIKFRQVTNVDKRNNGYRYSINDHLRGLILSMLSNHRQWGPIAKNMQKINEIFFDFDKNRVLNTNKNLFVEELTKIKCGNIAIAKQMESLDYNIGIFENIENEYGSIDDFITSDNPSNIAKKLSEAGKYKLKQIGYTLALEYLRNLGIEAIKPDTHIRRILGNERLNLCDQYPSEKEAVDILSKLSKELDMNLTYVDNLIWIFCAVDYGNICNEKVRCDICYLKELCNYQKENSLKQNNKMLKRYSSLLSYIEYFKSSDNSFFKKHLGQNKDGVIELGYVEYSDEVLKFIDMIYGTGFIFNGDYLDWRTKDFYSVEDIKQVIKNSNNIDTLRKILTYYIRGDRFCEGMIAGSIENKIFLDILLRVKELEQM